MLVFTCKESEPGLLCRFLLTFFNLIWGVVNPLCAALRIVLPCSNEYTMKNLLLLPALCLATPLMAQQTTGKVIYDQIVSTEFDENSLPEGIAAMIPKEQKFEKVLYFSPEATLYENSNKDNSQGKQEYKENNMEIRIERNMPDEKIYTDLKKQSRTEQRDLMGRTFLVSDKIAADKWKPTGRQKMLLGKPCMEAVAIQEQDTLTAWYTTAIPVPGGPGHIAGLPGLVLEAYIGKSLHLVAKSLETENGVADKIKVPAKGKKMTPEAFNRLQQEKMEEMRRQYGGKGNVIIMQR